MAREWPWSGREAAWKARLGSTISGRGRCDADAGFAGMASHVDGYCAMKPPSMTSSAPVMKEASSDARNNTPLATSSLAAIAPGDIGASGKPNRSQRDAFKSRSSLVN
jgi:hypothetical protein